MLRPSEIGSECRFTRVRPLPSASEKASGMKPIRPSGRPEQKRQNGEVIHRKRCPSPEGLKRRPLEPGCHCRTLSGQGAVCPLNSDQWQGCPWNEPSGVSPPTPRTGKVVPPLKSLPKGCCPWMQLSLIPSGLPPPLPFCWTMERGANGMNLGRGQDMKSQPPGCPLASGNRVVRCRPQTSLFGSGQPARLAFRYEILPLNPQPRTTRIPP